MKRLRDHLTTMDACGLGGVLLILVLGTIFLMKELG